MSLFIFEAVETLAQHWFVTFFVDLYKQSTEGPICRHHEAIFCPSFTKVPFSLSIPQL